MPSQSCDLGRVTLTLASSSRMGFIPQNTNSLANTKKEISANSCSLVICSKKKPRGLGRRSGAGVVALAASDEHRISCVVRFFMAVVQNPPRCECHECTQFRIRESVGSIGHAQRRTGALHFEGAVLCCVHDPTGEGTCSACGTDRQYSSQR